MYISSVTPKITLVGAGPGDAELITLKGWRALQQADVVLYDALIDKSLLDVVPASAVKVFTGKRAGAHSMTQEHINLLMVQYALSHGHVVRLKGGDPFVFGRGHEELEFAANFNIPATVIPGVSSCIAAPESQQVPLTSRGLSRSFWVLTATTCNGELADDLRLAAQSTATLVILMGIEKLSEIARLLAANGKSDLPVMVVQNATLPNERCAVGTAETIVELVRERGIGSPGVIVAGEVVRLHREFLEEVHEQVAAYA